jgi:hypothetical protein
MLLGGSRTAGAQPMLGPAELYRRLMATEFQPSELPAGFRLGERGTYLSEITPASQEYPGLVGAGVLQPTGQDLRNNIWYYVFATEADAQHHFEYGKFGRSTTSASQPEPPSTPEERPHSIPGPITTTITEAYEPTGLDRPAWCVAGKTHVWGWTSCSILTEYVEVVGYSSVYPGRGADRGNDANAVALAVAGVAHLDRL